MGMPGVIQYPSLPQPETFFNDVLEKRGGIRLRILSRRSDDVTREAVLRRLEAEDRGDLVAGVVAYYDYLHAQESGDFPAERAAWAKAVQILAPAQVVALMPDAWRQQLVGQLAYYFPPRI